jgi:hypothetical protein
LLLLAVRQDSRGVTAGIAVEVGLDCTGCQRKKHAQDSKRADKFHDSPLSFVSVQQLFSDALSAYLHGQLKIELVKSVDDYLLIFFSRTRRDTMRPQACAADNAGSEA